MSLQDWLFWLFALQAVFCALMVVANPFSRNPLASALFLILCILALAGLYVLLEAFFLAAVQVLVYAGAVIVLFLFVIMALGLQVEERQRFRKPVLIGGIAACATIGAILAATLATGIPKNVSGTSMEGSAETLGRLLFTKYVLPFEIMSALLLAAIVGVVLFGKKEKR